MLMLRLPPDTPSCSSLQPSDWPLRAQIISACFPFIDFNFIWKGKPCSFDNFYTSNILTSLENKDTFFPPRFDFQGDNKGKKETKNKPPIAPSIFSVNSWTTNRVTPSIVFLSTCIDNYFLDISLSVRHQVNADIPENYRNTIIAIIPTLSQ